MLRRAQNSACRSPLRSNCATTPVQYARPRPCVAPVLATYAASPCRLGPHRGARLNGYASVGTGSSSTTTTEQDLIRSRSSSRNGLDCSTRPAKPRPDGLARQPPGPPRYPRLRPRRPSSGATLAAAMAFARGTTSTTQPAAKTSALDTTAEPRPAPDATAPPRPRHLRHQRPAFSILELPHPVATRATTTSASSARRHDSFARTHESTLRLAPTCEAPRERAARPRASSAATSEFGSVLRGRALPGRARSNTPIVSVQRIRPARASGAEGQHSVRIER